MTWSKKRPCLKVRPYNKVRDIIETGWFILVAGDGVISRQVQRIVGSPYGHMATLIWDVRKSIKRGRDLSVLTVYESTNPDSRGVAFSSLVKRQPYQIDVFKLKDGYAPNLDLDGLWEWFHRSTGQDYPEGVLIHDWLQLRNLQRDNIHYPNSDDPETRRVCSQLWHAGYRVNGMPPIVEYDCDMYPVWYPDIFEYQFTPVLCGSE